MDRPLKAVPDNLFHNIIGDTTRSCVVILYKSHTANTASRQHSTSVHKMRLSEDAHFFQNYKRRWCIKTETGKRRQYISNLTCCKDDEISRVKNVKFDRRHSKPLT